MATLYKRANARQKRLLRIIEGAVHNTLHAHPDGLLDNERFARSVAKRAVGTISSQWGDLLALGDAVRHRLGGATPVASDTDGRDS